MRRRLWWHMCVPESRSAEDHGIHPLNLDRASDTSLPLNLDDSDLCSDMQSLPSSKQKWTEMTFALIKAEMTQMFQKITHTVSGSQETASAIESKHKLVQNHINHLETTYLKHCDENVPMQRVTVLSTRLVTAKMKFMIQQQLHQVSSGGEKQIYSEELLDAACNILEMHLMMQSDELIQGFSWYFRTFTQYHSLTYVLRHLCVIPTGPRVTRAWRLVECSFQTVDYSDIPYASGSKWTILRLLRGKAAQAQQTRREDSLIQDSCGAKNPLADMNSSISTSDLIMDTVIDPWYGSGSDLTDWDFWTWGS